MLSQAMVPRGGAFQLSKNNTLDQSGTTETCHGFLRFSSRECPTFLVGGLMPIRPENRARYPNDWKQISERIRFERAGNKCEQCSAPNGEVVYRFDSGEYMLEDGAVHDGTTGEFQGHCRGSEAPAGRFIKIVLTVAHLDHTPENCADDNLRAWCQRCHNIYDAPKRREGIRRRARGKMASGDLFE